MDALLQPQLDLLDRSFAQIGLGPSEGELWTGTLSLPEADCTPEECTG